MIDLIYHSLNLELYFKNHKLNIFIMFNNKNQKKGTSLHDNSKKFHQEGMNNVFSMIDSQENQIMSLLKKYGSNQPSSDHYFNHRTVD